MAARENKDRQGEGFILLSLGKPTVLPIGTMTIPRRIMSKQVNTLNKAY